jgi:hypothetical protein
MVILNIIFFTILVIVPFYFRFSWNDPIVFIGSDPQIKYYQTIQILEKGFSKEMLHCYFPAENLGFSNKFIPLGYPWAFIKESGECFFQYPIIMPLVHAIIAEIISIKSITYLPILFFIYNIFLTKKIFDTLEIPSNFGTFFSIFIHALSPIFLSSLDYSELTLTNTTLLLTTYFFLKLWNQPKANMVNLYLSGFFFSLNFQLRPESTIGIFIFFLTFVVLTNSYKEIISRIIPLGSIVLALTSFASLINYKIYGHPLGMRGWNTIQDASGKLSRNYYQDWVTDLWGSPFKIGIFQGYPVLFIMLLVLLISLYRFRHLEIKKESLVFFISGCAYIFILPILSPYRAGVDIFGLRYYETGVYFFSIGFCSLYYIYLKNLVNQSIDILVFRASLLLLISFLYFSYKSDLRAIKNWSGGVIRYKEIQSKINDLSPQIIVHRGLSLSYLMGVSYLKVPQIAIYSQEDWDKMIPEFQKNAIHKILYLQWEGNLLVKEEFPEKIWKEKFDINFNLVHPKEWSILDINLGHFKGTLISNEK